MPWIYRGLDQFDQQSKAFEDEIRPRERTASDDETAQLFRAERIGWARINRWIKQMEDCEDDPINKMSLYPETAATEPRLYHKTFGDFTVFYDRDEENSTATPFLIVHERDKDQWLTRMAQRFINAPQP